MNVGRLPFGVTPRNILHASRRRNEGLARVFHDLKLMEREGSGMDLMFERLLATGRGVPIVSEGTDSVHVTVSRRVMNPGVIRLLSKADGRFALTQRERIALALLSESDGLSAVELAQRLELDGPMALKAWLGRLLEYGLVDTAGRTKATRYFVPPALLRDSGITGRTTLRRMLPHRLRALVIEDVERYPDSGRADIHRRIGTEIHLRSLTRVLSDLVREGVLAARGERRWRTYRVDVRKGQVD